MPPKRVPLSADLWTLAPGAVETGLSYRQWATDAHWLPPTVLYGEAPFNNRFFCRQCRAMCSFSCQLWHFMVGYTGSFCSACDPKPSALNFCTPKTLPLKILCCVEDSHNFTLTTVPKSPPFSMAWFWSLERGPAWKWLNKISSVRKSAR